MSIILQNYKLNNVENHFFLQYYKNDLMTHI